MSTKTQTTTTHYHIQKKRRAEFIDEWRKYRQTVIRKDDVALEPTARGLRTGVYMGWDGDRPTRCLDALVHEVDPGTTTTIHRHSWDAILFMVEGTGWTEVDGVRYDWKPWDAIHIPAWSWHRHGTEGARNTRTCRRARPSRNRSTATIPMRGACAASRRKRRSAVRGASTRLTT